MDISNTLHNIADKEGLLASIVEATKDAVVTINVNSNIVIFNHGAEEVFGYKAEEVLNKPLTILLPEKVRNVHHMLVHKFDSEHRVGQEFSLNDYAFNSCDYRESVSTDCRKITGIRKNGEEFPIEATVTKVIFEGKKFFTSIIRDVSEREHYIEKIRQQDDELAAYRKRVKNQLKEELVAVAATKIQYRT